jgi:hypothetical protein
MKNTTTTNYYGMGHDAGANAGTWHIDAGRWTAREALDTAHNILAGYEDGYPNVMERCPSPLSGEWAGESIPELFDLAPGEDWPDDDDLADYEDGFTAGWWDTVLGDCWREIVAHVTIDRATNGLFTVSGIVSDGGGKWLETLAILPSDEHSDDLSLAQLWHAHIVARGYWPTI